MTSEDWNNLLFTSLDHWIDDRGTLDGGAFAVYFVIGVSFGSCIQRVHAFILLLYYTLDLCIYTICINDVRMMYQ